ncbi:MAG TPA: suppressor of fused domain protein [Candidatus Melainabacteria bacterium]|jgi:hypothetical protein|nr:suppressor of fused domain protein [Candidatus Melainabacteria bacterium]HIN67041.1 suppressor of fused domain protein [Candidatus Obscuribacterales bacterium]
MLEAIRAHQGSTMPRTQDFQLIEDEAVIIDANYAVEQHLEDYIGEVTAVIGDAVAGSFDANDINVAVIEPTKKKPYYTLCTMGMSNIRMPAPNEDSCFAEILTCLPKDWNFDDLDDPDWNWPINWLKDIASYAYTHNAYLSFDHTIPNGNPPEPVASNTDFCGFLIALPLNFPGDFYQLRIGKEKCINFYSIIPLYEEEMQFTLSNKIEKFYKKLFDNKVNEIININRPNLCLRK